MDNSNNKIRMCSHCKRMKAIYPYNGKYYCHDHYDLGTEFDKNMKQLFGTEYICNSHVTIGAYDIINNLYPDAVLIKGNRIRISIDDTTIPSDIDGPYILLIFEERVSVPFNTGVNNNITLHYKGRVSILSSDNKYTSFRELTTIPDENVTVIIDDDSEDLTRLTDDDWECYVGNRSDDEQLEDSEHIDKIVELLDSGQSIFLTGEAGTGKSHNMKLLMKRLTNCAATASTGPAAFNIRGTTIHRWAGLGRVDIGEFLRNIASKEKDNSRLHMKYRNYVQLEKYTIDIHKMKQIGSEIDHIRYVRILYWYLQFLHPTATQDEVLSAVIELYKSKTEPGIPDADTIKKILAIDAMVDYTIRSGHLFNTIRELSEIDDKQILRDICDAMDKFVKYNVEYRVNTVEYLILDEISMISNHFMEILDWQMRTLRGRYNEFMGGIVCIFVGDLLQLPPVDDDNTVVYVSDEGTITVRRTKEVDGVRREEEPIIVDDIGSCYIGDILNRKAGRYRCTYVTEYSEWSKNVRWYILTDNHRQADDSTFRDILNSIRIGKGLTRLQRHYLNSRVTTDELDNKIKIKDRDKEQVSIDDTVLYGNNKQCGVRNKRCLAKLKTPMYQYDADYVITYSKGNRTLQSSSKAILFRYREPNDLSRISNKNRAVRGTLQLKVGAKVLLLANLNIDKGFVNGAIGRVETLSYNRITVRFDHNNDVLTIPMRLYEVCSKKSIDKHSSRYIETKIYMRQYPLTLAYGITIHKSQGNTYKDVAVSLTYTDIPCPVKRDSKGKAIIIGESKQYGKCTAYGKAYVALSRCKTLSGLKILLKYPNSEIPWDRFVADKRIVNLYDKKMKEMKKHR